MKLSLSFAVGCFLPILLSGTKVSGHATGSSATAASSGLPPFLSRAAEQRRREQKEAPPEPKILIQEYELWEPQEIRERVMRWADHYSDFVHVTTSQDAYGLPTAGGATDCPFDLNVTGCLNYILTIQDYDTHPEGSDSSNRLPEVLWSGEVHGNEQVGPTAVLEAAQLLMDAATCEAHPRREIRVKDPAAWDNELTRAQTCRQEMKAYDITDSQRQWLARLVTTRRIVIVPTANALGYFRKVREEDMVDPNRDFPYDLTKPDECMVTVAARTLNEVFREHMFQLSLTFHGGMEVVGYEWGAPSWDQQDSPDDTAQSAISTAYSRYGGGWSTSAPYKHGPMNDVVYPVRGGMEDWAYAASWDPERVIQCQPTTFGGYPKEKTTYNNSTLRVFNMLVETSNKKIPNKNDLGTSLNLLDGQSEGNGHVARNIRLALLAADLVEPYLSIVGVNELTMSDDIVPLARREGLSCQWTNLVSIPANSGKVTLQWTVGGALQIDATQILYAKWSDIPEDVLDCATDDAAGLEAYMKAGSPISTTSGAGRFASGPTEHFSASIDISEGFQPLDKIVVIAKARVDQSWRDQGTKVAPNIPPQSHVVNARTDPSWRHESAGKVIQGRLEWISIPLTITIRGDSSEIETVEASNRFGRIDIPDTRGRAEPSDRAGPTKTEAIRPGSTPPVTFDPVTGTEKLLAFLVFAGITVGLAVGARAYLREQARRGRRTRVREFIEDPSAPSPGLKFKKKNGGKVGYNDIPDHTNGEVEMGQYTDVV
jgi:hypothetical protein